MSKDAPNQLNTWICKIPKYTSRDAPKFIQFVEILNIRSKYLYCTCRKKNMVFHIITVVPTHHPYYYSNYSLDWKFPWLTWKVIILWELIDGFLFLASSEPTECGRTSWGCLQSSPQHDWGRGRGSGRSSRSRQRSCQYGCQTRGSSQTVCGHHWGLSAEGTSHFGCRTNGSLCLGTRGLCQSRGSNGNSRSFSP